MTSSRRSLARLAALFAVFALVFAACGDDEDTSTETTEAEESETTEAEETETTEAEETETTEAEETETTEAEEGGAAADGVPIALAEWTISDPGALAAGSFTFALENTGENPHALAIARGTSYEELPLKENGAVDTDALGDDFLGASDNVDPGGTGSIDFDLEAGDYVFFCPIEFGPNSHAGAGQVLSVTVGE